MDKQRVTAIMFLGDGYPENLPPVELTGTILEGSLDGPVLVVLWDDRDPDDGDDRDDGVEYDRHITWREVNEEGYLADVRLLPEA